MKEKLVVTKNELIPAVITYFKNAKEDPENYMDSNNLDEKNYIQVASELVDTLFEIISAERPTSVARLRSTAYCAGAKDLNIHENRIRVAGQLDVIVVPRSGSLLCFFTSKTPIMKEKKQELLY